MDRRTLLFVLISVVVFVLWSVFQGPPRRPQPEPEPSAANETESTGPVSPAPGPAGVGQAKVPEQTQGEKVPGGYGELADILRRSAVTTVVSSTCEIEVAHRTASIRAWRMLEYPVRRPKGRLGGEPTDLVAVYSPDYAGTRVNGDLLTWTPVGTPPKHITLSGPAGVSSLAFRAQYRDVEVTKIFRFRADPRRWFGYAVDVELAFRNVGERPTDALTYDLTWGPGITGDREQFNPDYGALGGTLTRTALPSFRSVRDRDPFKPGSQDKGGELVDMDGRRTIWAAMDSKYYVAALLTQELEPVRGVEREAVFSDYAALDLPWDAARAREREIARLKLLSSIGKEWMTNADHLWRERTRHMLMLLPAGSMGVNDEILAQTAKVKDDAKAHVKLEQGLQRVYAEYTTVMGLLSGTRLQTSGFFLDPGQAVTDRYRLYAGPKDTEMLGDVLLPDDQTPAHMHETIRLGFFGPVAKALLWLLKLFHGAFHNYGAAIILLTIVVRVVLYPLSQRSSESMKRMQTRMKIIQPQVDDLRRKFKDDPQRVNTEMVKVYRRYGVNPAGQLGGCLVMVAQMPIFIAMFQMLGNAAELRGQAFTLWITDLTAPDLLLTVAGIPVRVLPLVMTAGTILQQKMNPASGTMGGSQRTMMYLMPVMFLFILYNMASGLNLYWGASTLLGVAQQYLVNRFGKSTGEENLTAADLERMAAQDRKKQRRRIPALRPR